MRTSVCCQVLLCLPVEGTSFSGECEGHVTDPFSFGPEPRLVSVAKSHSSVCESEILSK